MNNPLSSTLQRHLNDGTRQVFGFRAGVVQADLSLLQYIQGAIICLPVEMYEDRVRRGSTMTYHEVLEHAERLAPEDQLRLLEDLAALVRRQITTRVRHSILELQGLGKEIWQGIDVDDYLEQERLSWNG